LKIVLPRYAKKIYTNCPHNARQPTIKVLTNVVVALVDEEEMVKPINVKVQMKKLTKSHANKENLFYALLEAKLSGFSLV